MTAITGHDDVTELLRRVANGEQDAFDVLLERVYPDLHHLALRSMRSEGAGHTLQATALVHEAYLKLIDQRKVAWTDRSHFFALAARIIRRILVDHARARRAAKRGGEGRPLTLAPGITERTEHEVDLVALDDALASLAEHNPMHAQLVEMRYFGGLTIPEIAHVLGIGKRSVDREWAYARAWLYRELREDS